MAIKIDTVAPGSDAQALGLGPGDELVAVDGNAINDALDYQFYTDSPGFHLTARVQGAIRELEVARQPGEDFGCNFATYLGDKKHSCANRCIFCFIDQMPPGMRESLYFKDDDERLSFLFGNYITLTNLTRQEMDRIKLMHISPINISVHAVDPELRVQMMKNRFAGDLMPRMQELAEAGIEMNCQLVLCRGINDGEALARSMQQLCALWPRVQSVAAVPIGVTRYREGLPQLQTYDRESAAKTLDQMLDFGDRMLKLHGERIVYPADEWFFLAGRPLPPAEFYGGYYQLDNGVGMCRKFYDEFMEELKKPHRVKLPCRADSICGESVYPLVVSLADALMKKYRFVKLRVHCIRNDFFGGNVSVTGLLTGQDIAAQAAGKEDVLLDDMTVEELGRRLNAEVTVLPSDGGAFARAALGLPVEQQRGSEVGSMERKE